MKKIENNKLDKPEIQVDQKKIPLGVENDINVIIKSKDDGILFDQDCCTVINIILNNDNEIATSFLGIHSKQIIKELEKAQKMYFKALKKALKDERRRIAEDQSVNNNESNNSEQPSIAKSSECCEHVCNKNGDNIVKKKINPKENPKSHPKQAKTANLTNSKSSKNRIK